MPTPPENPSGRRPLALICLAATIVVAGGFASVIFGSVVFWAKWRQAEQRGQG